MGNREASDDRVQVILEARGKTLDLEQVVGRLAVVKLIMCNEFNLSAARIGRPVMSTAELQGINDLLSGIYYEIAEYVYGEGELFDGRMY